MVVVGGCGSAWWVDVDVVIVHMVVADVHLVVAVACGSGSCM